jgi:SAM-dependent methyltransferase
MSKKSLEEIVKSEAEIHDEDSLDRGKIRKLRRHAFHYSTKRMDTILHKIVATFNNKELLEYGSSTWIYWLKGKSEPKKVTCINISEVRLKHDKSFSDSVPFEMDFLLMDANELKFPDESFDVVYGGAILHHLDIEKSLGHVHRVLKPGGYILFGEPLNINPLYKLYRFLNPKERTPDEHALVLNDFKIIREKFTFEHYFFDFFSVFTGFVSLKIYGDKNYNNWINKTGYYLDVILSKIPFSHVLFARVLIYGKKK